MKKLLGVLSILIISVICASFFVYPIGSNAYRNYYKVNVSEFMNSQSELLSVIQKADLKDPTAIKSIKKQIGITRLKLKRVDFWLRYLEPIAYKKLNGPLPVEWETEVFEKFEAPYKREGAGLTLAELYLNEKSVHKDSLVKLIESSKEATAIFQADSITYNLNTYHHFFLSNRLFLLNLAAIYTTGFECPEPGNIVPELRSLLQSVNRIYETYNESFPSTPLKSRYLALYANTLDFVKQQSNEAEGFNHFLFLKDYVNPLFKLNQEMIHEYRVKSASYNDYSLNNESVSIFDKSLYKGQNTSGVYYSIKDEKILNEIKETGKLLFYDPILSANSKRSCVSCHKPGEYFTDTVRTTALQFDPTRSLSRNTPSLINVVYNHLVNADGKHFNLQGQAKDVLTNPAEMGNSEAELLKKILSVDAYQKAFKRFSRLTPYSPKISLDHVASALSLYYGGFSTYYSPFDDVMNEGKSLSNEAIAGFNLFMGKAQCGTCHFVPQFNGVKPPYTGSEFEVLGVPGDSLFSAISADQGRFGINPSKETKNAFRTGTVRNAFFTKPYMHNGIFRTLEEVVDFYNTGGGTGKSLSVSNQTLSADSLKLTETETKDILEFIRSLTERVDFQKSPDKLPVSSIKSLNTRKIGGEY